MMKYNYKGFKFWLISGIFSFFLLIAHLPQPAMGQQTVYTLNALLLHITDHSSGCGGPCSPGQTHYILGNDLGEGESFFLPDPWNPINLIGTLAGRTLDGNGHTINGLTISTTNGHSGLFGRTENTTIRNLGLINATVTSSSNWSGYRTAVLVGEATNTTIQNCYVSGSISVTGTVPDNAANIGGLVGRMNGGSVTNSWANVNINTNGWLVGSLIGTMTNHGGAGATVTQSFATGNISASNRWIGGLVGQFGGGSTISDSYATGNVSGSAAQVGGLVGRQWTGSSIIRSYSIGSVSGSSAVGGFVGQLDSDHLTHCYWDTQVSGTTTGLGSGSSSGLTGRTTTQMKTQTNFTTWNFTGTWGIYNDLTYPWLRWETTEIENWNDLNNIRRTMVLHYVLQNDLHSGTTGYSGTGNNWTPIGTSGNRFTGIFNGDDYTISGLQISGAAGVGLFGYAGKAFFLNVGLRNVDVTGSGVYVGALIGQTTAHVVVYNCYSTGNVTSNGDWNVGGLLGQITDTYVLNSWSSANVVHTTGSGGEAGGLVGQSISNSTISSSFATGNVSGYRWVGGLAGRLRAGNVVLDSYARGNASGSNVRIGGLVGFNEGSISRSYATGSASGSTEVGGLVGRNDGTVQNSFWDTEKSGNSSSAGGTGRNTTQMRTQSNFTNAGWDFTDTWDTYDELSYPYLQWETTEIENWNDLNDIRHTMVLHYVLQNNLHSGTSGYGGTGNNWSPLGTFTADSFTGIFDGNEYSISSLEIEATEVDAGLFGYAEDASFLNLGLENVDISTTTDRVGALVGRSDNIVVSNCYSTGNIVSTGRVNAGGLIGYTTGASLITKSWSSVNIDHNWSGGNAVNTGGLIAAINDGKLSMSFATGSIHGEEDTGGLVGRNYGIIENSYARGNITGSVNRTGGLVGRNANDGSITNSYSTGLVRGESGVGGLIGINESGGSASNSYWDMDVSGQTESGDGTGRTHTEMKTQNQFSGWNFSSIWNIEEGHSYPWLQWETDTAPIQVTSWADLNNVRNDLGGYYILMNELDEESGSYGGTGNDWTPIGTDANRFTGLFDGNEYSISGLILNHDDVDSGLFGYAEGASFLNLGLLNVDITSSDERAGALVGRSDNIVVSNCYATGNIVSTGRVNIAGLIGFTTGPSLITKSWSSVDIDHNWSGGTGVNTGGLIGALENDGKLSMSFATGNVSGEDGVGGLVGRHSGIIENSYARGNVTGSVSRTGGLVGRNEDGSITNSYSTGLVSGGGSVGGLIATSIGGSADNSFWDTNLSGQASSDGGTGQTRANMRKAATFTSAGWDFTNVWDIHEDNSYPFLRENNPTPHLDWLGVTTGTPLRPHWFSFNTERGMAIVEEGENTLMLVQSALLLSDDVHIHIIDAETGKDAGFMNLPGYITSGALRLSDVAVSDDNKIFISNYAQIEAHGAFRVQMYEDTGGTGRVTVLEDTRISDGDWSLARTITISGSYTLGTATLYAVSDAGNQLIRYTQTGPGETFGNSEVISLSEDVGSNPTASAARPGAAPFYQTGTGQPIRKYDADGTLIGTIPTNIAPTGTSRVQFLGTSDDGDDYIAVYIWAETRTQMIRVPGGVPENAVIEATTASLGSAPNPNGTGDIRFVDTGDGYDVYLLATNNGIKGTRMDWEDITLTTQEDLHVGGAERGWRMFSMPVGGVSIKDLSDQYFVQGFGPDLYPRFGANILFVDAEANAWSAKGRDQNYEFPAGEGFIWFFYNGETGGYPNDHPLPVWLSVDGLTPGDDIEAYSLAQGSNLMGNPFNRDLYIYEDIYNVWANGGELGSVNVQVWDNTGSDHGAEPENGGYSHSGTWRVIGETGQHGQKIAPWQGFVIDNEEETHATQITIPKSAAPRFRGRETGFYKSEEKPSWHRLSFSLLNIEANGNRMVTDEAASLLFHPEASEGWDIYDAAKMTPVSDRFATLSFLGERNGESILKAQESRPLDFEGQIEIPVSFESYELAGRFEIKWDGLDELPEEWYLMLADHEAGTLTDLRLEESLAFSIEEPLRRSSARDGETQKGFASGGAPAQLSAEELAGSEVLPFIESLSLPVHFSGLRKYGTQGSATRFTLIVSTEPISGEILADLPEEVELSQNYPNPFNPVTVLPYALPEESHVRLTIYDVLGRQVAVLVDGVKEAGRYEVSWDATRQASGVYIYRLEAGGEAFTRKMTLVK